MCARNAFLPNGGAIAIAIRGSAGQLVSQLMAANTMMGFLELPFAVYYTVLIPCLFVESIGLTHSSYVLKDVLQRLAGIDASEADPAKAITKNWLYHTKCFISVSAVIFAGIFLFKGLALKQTNATNGPGWENLPGWAAILVSLFFLFILACAEGLQVIMSTLHVLRWKFFFWGGALNLCPGTMFWARRAQWIMFTRRVDD